MMAVGRIRELLGGEPVTGPLRTERDLVQLIRRGVPTAAVDHFLDRTALSFSAIEAQVVNRRTFRRRQETSRTLDPTESDRLLRLVALVAMAEETFGDHDKAMTWLNRNTAALGGETPLAMADTDQGACAVETLLGRIAHGIAA